MHKPFEELGQELKAIRNKQHESLIEVSGAVEIEIDALERIEVGQERPSEDLLMLLIQHFNVVEDEALNLWQLAGYYDPRTFERTSPSNDINRSLVVMMALDTRILYTDESQVIVDRNGVVLNFLQAGSIGNQRTPIARIGMSHEQAKSLLRNLHKSLLIGSSKQEPKRLTTAKHRPITKNKKTKSKK